MSRVVDTPTGLMFVGDLDDSVALQAAAHLAHGCAGFSADDDDECYVGEGRSCFDCGARRWVPGGFSCMRDRLGG